MLMRWQLPLLESAAASLSRGWMVLLVGGAGSGKTHLAGGLSALCGQKLIQIPLTPGTDTSDLLGSFEQVEPSRRLRESLGRVRSFAASALKRQLLLCSPLLNGWQREGEGEGEGVRWGREEALAAAVKVKGALTEAIGPSESSGSSSPLHEGRDMVRRMAALALACLDLLSIHRQISEVESDSPKANPLISEEEELQSFINQDLATLQALYRMKGLDSGESEGEGEGKGEEGFSSAGRFEWVDGTLTRAVEHGGWVLLDNANLVNPTVLDRLNPLLEPGGKLALPECGTANGRVSV